MTETTAQTVLRYDHELYNRSFLNCYQRQALVMLEEYGIDVRLLLGGAYLSAEAVVDEVVRTGTPRHSLDSALVSTSNLELAGVRAREVMIESFAHAEADIPGLIEKFTWVHLIGDVFYCPHRAEYYRKTHITHCLTIVGSVESRHRWHIIDDNNASVLERYEYPTAVLAAVCDNAVAPALRTFDCDPVSATAETALLARAALRSRVAEQSQGDTLWVRGRDLVENVWESRTQAIAKLLETVTAFLGNRQCVDAFLAHVESGSTAHQAAVDVVGRAKPLRTQLMVATATGILNQSLWDNLEQLGEAEHRLTESLST